MLLTRTQYSDANVKQGNKLEKHPHVFALVTDSLGAVLEDAWCGAWGERE